ncbi:MAG TPA: FkbM family methyltransferase [Candidatus Binataceae bacterium]|nr:FkbM family methyltransferase [Candidatus Binataceae bacterium]
MPLSSEVEVVSAHVGKLLILKNDVGVSECIRTSGVWAPKDVELFSSLIKPQMFVADVGAYIGHHTVHFSRLVGPSGFVVAFEPQKIPFRVLNANLLLNACRNVEVYNCALGADPEQVELWPHKSKANFGAVPVVRLKAGAIPVVIYKGEVTLGSGGETVDLSTLDIMLSRHRKLGRKIDFIKIDVQAFELFALQGATNILAVDRPWVFFEVSPYWMVTLMGYDYLEIYRLFESLNYLVVDPHGDHHRPTQRRWSGDQDEEWDCLAIPQ